MHRLRWLWAPPRLVLEALKGDAVVVIFRWKSVPHGFAPQCRDSPDSIVATAEPGSKRTSLSRQLLPFRFRIRRLRIPAIRNVTGNWQRR